jgi:hypothetical protein
MIFAEEGSGFFSERQMEFALHLLPHILIPPMKMKQRTSMDEAATNFIQIHPVG